MLRHKDTVALVTGLERALFNLGVLTLDAPPSPPEAAIDVGPTEAVRARVGGIFVPTLREDAIGAIVPAGTEMGKMLDLHTLAELQVFTPLRADGNAAPAPPDLYG